MFQEPTNRSLERKHRLGRGLFILRYMSSKAAPNECPSVLLKLEDPRCSELIGVSNKESYLLRGPGDGVVIQTSRETALALHVQPRFRGGSVDAELHCEPVSRFDTTPPPAAVTAVAGDARLQPRLDELEFLAHLAQRGDIVVPHGDWIGGPRDPRAIEGLEVRWPRRPIGFEIITRVTVANGDLDLPESLTGEFIGTRGRGSPITCFDMKLCGARASELVFRSDALFRGSPVQSQVGRAISFVGPTGREPLVGLRVTVMPAVAVAQRAPVRDIAKEAAAPASQRPPAPGRVRVFRGRKQSGPAVSSRSLEQL